MSSSGSKKRKQRMPAVGRVGPGRTDVAAKSGGRAESPQPPIKSEKDEPGASAGAGVGFMLLAKHIRDGLKSDLAVAADGASILDEQRAAAALMQATEIISSMGLPLSVFSAFPVRSESPLSRDAGGIRHVAPKLYLDMWDGEVQRSAGERFAAATSEKIDPSRLSLNEKEYTALWTNRVAMWRFFEHLVSPLLAAEYATVEPILQFHGMAVAALGSVNAREHRRLINPFRSFEHAFGPVMKAWMPCMKRIVRLFERNTPRGHNFRDDFLSISTIAFLHALEKQAMAILGNPRQAQSLPFPKRLEFAVRKAIYSEIPDLTGPVRVPVESKQRKDMPIEVPLDYWDDDHFGF